MTPQTSEKELAEIRKRDIHERMYATSCQPDDDQGRYITAALTNQAQMDRSALLRLHDAVCERLKVAEAERDRLRAEINTPHTAEFLTSVEMEAIHQRQRWAADHDGGKTDADWFWLIGYLAGKALHKPEKQLHHIITTAAACLNWHARKVGADTRMRPGIDAILSSPKEQQT